MELFSVLMSVYIKEEATFLDWALQSILVDQTVKPSELVLVEDGPLTKELYRVIDKYKCIFPSFISVKLSENVGLGKALNAGLKYCHNEWVARMDSDDISLPTRFEKQLEYIKTHPDIDVLGCAVGEFENDEHIVTSVKVCPISVDSYIKFRSPVNHPTVFFRKSSVLQVGSYRHCPFMEDYHLWIRMYAAGMKITSLQESLYLFKMDRNAQKRRGGITYIKSEMNIQKLLLDSGVISRCNYCTNLILRCGARLLPGSYRAFLYKLFFRRSRVSYEY
ncbi:glycosyltransferase [Alistipes shahii]